MIINYSDIIKVNRDELSMYVFTRKKKHTFLYLGRELYEGLAAKCHLTEEPGDYLVVKAQRAAIVILYIFVPIAFFIIIFCFWQVVSVPLSIPISFCFIAGIVLVLAATNGLYGSLTFVKRADFYSDRVTLLGMWGYQRVLLKERMLGYAVDGTGVKIIYKTDGRFFKKRKIHVTTTRLYVSQDDVIAFIEKHYCIKSAEN